MVASERHTPPILTYHFQNTLEQNYPRRLCSQHKALQTYLANHKTMARIHLCLVLIKQYMYM
jgi:hypothetical protein